MNGKVLFTLCDDTKVVLPSPPPPSSTFYSVPLSLPLVLVKNLLFLHLVLPLDISSFAFCSLSRVFCYTRQLSSGNDVYFNRSSIFCLHFTVINKRNLILLPYDSGKQQQNVEGNDKERVIENKMREIINRSYTKRNWQRIDVYQRSKWTIIPSMVVMQTALYGKTGEYDSWYFIRSIAKSRLLIGIYIKT